MEPWKTRDVLEVEETCPKVEELRAAALPLVLASVPVVAPEGALKFGWLRRLKASRRSCMERRSQIGQTRETCASNWYIGGLRKELRMMFA